ncbi:unnamed protein product [Echinostoma caproni]|uniref:G_PROTEIN_RECEP_F1_2 domain-containing protein n=1 Tax=Echinostoma caproni TaxID=27848 RepID=A0A183AKG3_9TREM|nr:unnamed protein product [Echinostoma caproni]
MNIALADNVTVKECHSLPVWIQLPVILIQLFGIPANLLVFHAISHIRLGSRLTTQLLRSQCLFDGLTCLCALLKVSQPGRWYTGSHVINHLLCHIWFTYTLFWLFVLLSLSNLVCTAFDRFNAVAFNVSYQKKQKVHCGMFYVGMILYSTILVSLSPLLLQYDESKWMCVPYHHGLIPVLDLIVRIDSMCWPWLTYFIPCCVMIVLYGKLIALLRKPYLLAQTPKPEINPLLSKLEAKGKRQRQVAQSLTIATLIMQTLFLVTHSFDRIYYFLGVNGWTEYQVGSIPHLLGLWAITLNSCINPTALIMTMRPLQIWLLRLANRLRRSLNRRKRRAVHAINLPMQICSHRTVPFRPNHGERIQPVLPMELSQDTNDYMTCRTKAFSVG